MKRYNWSAKLTFVFKGYLWQLISKLKFFFQVIFVLKPVYLAIWTLSIYLYSYMKDKLNPPQRGVSVEKKITIYIAKTQYDK